MSFNVDHSETFPDGRRKPSATIGNCCFAGIFSDNTTYSVPHLSLFQSTAEYAVL